MYVHSLNSLTNESLYFGVLITAVPYSNMTMFGALCLILLSYHNAVEAEPVHGVDGSDLRNVVLELAAKVEHQNQLHSIQIKQLIDEILQLKKQTEDISM